MRLFKKSILPIVFVCFLLLQCDTILSPEDNLFYPKKINGLSLEERNKLQKEFDEFNNYTINAKLNEFGFIGKDTTFRIPGNSILQLSSDEALELAIDAIVKNKKYTNASNRDYILSNDINVRNIGNSICWNIHFGPQKYKNLYVLFSEMDVYIYDGKVFSIYNSWYPDAIIPSEDKIDSADAKKAIKGISISYITGVIDVTFEVKENDIGKVTQKVIVPDITDDSLALRVAWEVEIKLGNIIGWYVYVDTTTGEILYRKQNAVFPT